ncbi:ubiquinol-cytochrome-c reductase complex assembly factor 4 [Erinaceus europaeus]|uniref:Ubiquinol-cytochrome-c reductase complex assembly factor 4 n=1 Tax=Erinaceus europaeus TaxID=9365 RepID=A0A1S3WHV9_ERIEU|nr:ubiquinol-cytochrome-c reductase complex assembly factor 4 [Erinaceus europaeus]
MSWALRPPTAGAVWALRLARPHSRSLHRTEDDSGRPFKFSSSGARPERWTVGQSLGSEQQRSWWRVLPFSLPLILLVAWCFLRQETSSDHWLSRVLDGEAPEPAGRGPGS